MTSVAAFERWPEKVIDFLLDHVQFIRVESTVSNLTEEMEPSGDPVGDPLRISCE